MTNKEIAQWIRTWFNGHPNCKELDSMYEDFSKLSTSSVKELTALIWKMDPLKYMTHIPDHMFLECQDITNIIIPNNITSIGEEDFTNCASLKSVDIRDDVHSIGDWAFEGCSNLTSVTFAENSQLTSIGERAFYNCSGLASIEIPTSVTSIGARAFYDCSSLTSIHFGGTMVKWKALTKGSEWNYGTGSYTVYCTDGNLSE